MNASNPNAPQPFIHYLKVRYSECDMQKVVFNAKYAEYVDIAATEYMRTLWGPYDELLASGKDNQVVSLTINWRAPAKFDQVLAIEVYTAYVGNTSFSLEMRLLRHAQNTVLAEAKVTYVMIDARTHHKQRISTALRKSLNQGATGQFTNHAGLDLSEP